jgi:hypothetical protein
MGDRVIEFRDEKQKWTKSEVERFAYLHFKIGLGFSEIKTHFDITLNQYNALVDYVNCIEQYKRWLR